MELKSGIYESLIYEALIYWIVAFVRFSGIRIFENALREFLTKPTAKLKLITTTYMCASEPKAVEFLKQLAPDKVEIRVSYNCDLDRLHAKSYIFVRESGMNTAYIGSSNISRSALTKGLEWNIRITHQENPHIIQKAILDKLTVEREIRQSYKNLILVAAMWNKRTAVSSCCS